jgi:hypothetical protein
VWALVQPWLAFEDRCGPSWKRALCSCLNTASADVTFNSNVANLKL